MKLLRRLSAEAGFEPYAMRHLSHHPTYFLFSTWVYRIAVMVERPVRRYDVLAPVRHMLHVILRKPVDLETT